MDTITLINMIKSRKTLNLHLLPILQEVLFVLDHLDWNCEMSIMRQTSVLISLQS